MENYYCAIADLAEIEARWREKEALDSSAAFWKEKAINGFKNGNRIYYYGFLRGKVICEAAALLSEDEVQNGEGLAGGEVVYLSAFKTEEQYRGRGYFSALYKFMENDLKMRGYKKLTLGVEPCEVKNMMIYFKWGFTEFIKTDYEEYPVSNGKKPEKIMVNYYAKRI